MTQTINVGFFASKSTAIRHVLQLVKYSPCALTKHFLPYRFVYLSHLTKKHRALWQRGRKLRNMESNPQKRIPFFNERYFPDVAKHTDTSLHL